MPEERINKTQVSQVPQLKSYIPFMILVGIIVVIYYAFVGVGDKAIAFNNELDKQIQDASSGIHSLAYSDYAFGTKEEQAKSLLDDIRKRAERLDPPWTVVGKKDKFFNAIDYCAGLYKDLDDEPTYLLLEAQANACEIMFKRANRHAI